jgi:hypothetical protein
MQPAVEPEPGPADALTIAGIGLVTYMLANVLHEALGHAGACVISGAKPIVLSSVLMECSVDNRLVTAGGTLVNLAAGAIFFVLGRLTGRTHHHLRYFFWLAMSINFFMGNGYFLFSGVGGFGDWAIFIQGLGPQWAWRVGMTIVGAATYMLAVLLSLLEIRPLIGSAPEQRRLRAVRLSKIPYFFGGIFMCLTGLLNPQGMVLVAVSAAASSFGGASALLWAPYWLEGHWIPFGPAAEPMSIPRSWPWIMTSFVLAVAFVVVLGPGVRFAGAPAP